MNVKKYKHLFFPANRYKFYHVILKRTQTRSKHQMLLTLLPRTTHDQSDHEVKKKNAYTSHSHQIDTNPFLSFLKRAQMRSKHSILSTLLPRITQVPILSVSL